ncbi:MAG: formylmethanofuran dehydrogenase subunit B [Candidatus Syntropharchaeia archaeon]
MAAISDVVCPFCGSLCDDIEVIVEGNGIKDVKRACKLGKSKIMGHERIKSPLIRENGKLKEISYEEAIERAAKILYQSKRPLMYGWSSTVCEAHKKGIELAEEIGAVIDNTASVCHGPTVIAIQGVGSPGCTLGEIKNRADLVIFWGCNPVEAHPRHRARYSHTVKGFFVKGGKKDRKILVFDVRKTKTAGLADDFIQLEPNSDYAVFSALRTILAGNADVIPNKVGGVPKEKLIEIVETMKNAKFGVIFGGMGLTHSRGRYKNLECVISLVDELNMHTKFTLIPMRGHYNVAGFNHVCAWETGYPFAVDFSRGYPWYNPGETAANDLLRRKECDSMLVIAADPAAHFPRKSVEHMSGIPVIQMDPFPNPTTEFADIVIPTAISGIESEGTAYRMDGVPLRVKKLVDSEYPTDEEVLGRMLEEIRKMRGG